MSPGTSDKGPHPRELFCCIDFLLHTYLGVNQQLTQKYSLPLAEIRHICRKVLNPDLPERVPLEEPDPAEEAVE